MESMQNEHSPDQKRWGEGRVKAEQVVVFDCVVQSVCSSRSSMWSFGASSPTFDANEMSTQTEARTKKYES